MTDHNRRQASNTDHVRAITAAAADMRQTTAMFHDVVHRASRALKLLFAVAIATTVLAAATAVTSILMLISSLSSRA